MLTATRHILFSGTSTGLRDLTLANVITDGPQRADGLSVPGGFGVWPAATNLVTNGGFETNTTGWGTDGTNTIATSTTQAKFGAKSCIATYQSDVRLLTLSATGYSGLAAGANIFSCWVWVPTAYDGTLPGIFFQSFTLATGNVSTATAVAIDLTKRDQWQQVTASAVIDSGDLVGNILIRENGSAPTAGRFIYVDGCQLETGSVATPYIETDGGTAARSAARVQVTTQGLLTPTQGAVVARCYFPYANTARTGDGILFSFRDAANDLVELRYDFTAAVWELERNNAGTGTVHTFADTWAADAGVTVFGAATATALKLSVDGAAFTSAADTNIPTISATSADFGSDGSSGSYISANVRWAITFRGDPTSADAALGWMTQDAVPTLNQLRQLSAASKPTLLIPADTSMARLLPAYFGGTL